MHFDFSLFLSALGLAVMLEAVPYTLFPDKMSALLRRLSEEGPSALRRMGLVALCLGLVLLWLARRG